MFTGDRGILGNQPRSSVMKVGLASLGVGEENAKWWIEQFVNQRKFDPSIPNITQYPPHSRCETLKWELFMLKYG
jgi:hypothetical protein